MTKQDQIIQEVAKRHGIAFSKGKLIFNNIGATISSIIEASPRDEEGYIIHETMHVISLVHFGKFIPSKRRVVQINKMRKNKKDGKL